jgi:hypothetical protein
LDTEKQGALPGVSHQNPKFTERKLLTLTMGKSARTARVEEPRLAQRDRRALPSWYPRVLLISFKEDREVNGYDFDEDLSELEEGKRQERDDI